VVDDFWVPFRRRRSRPPFWPTTTWAVISILPLDHSTKPIPNGPEVLEAMSWKEGAQSRRETTAEEVEMEMSVLNPMGFTPLQHDCGLIFIPMSLLMGKKWDPTGLWAWVWEQAWVWEHKDPVRLAYQSPASSTFLSEQTSHQQSTSSTFLSEQISTSHQPPS
jgi:hypothetical protein